MDQQSTETLVCKSHTKEYVGVLIVGLVLGAGASFVFFRQAPAIIGGGAYEEGFNAAKARILESPMGMTFKTPDDIRSISGRVSAISGNRVTIHISSQNPFDDQALVDRTVNIPSDTKITKVSPPDQKAFQAEMDAFVKKVQAGKSAGITPPRLPESTVLIVGIAGVKLGDTITVIATENIKSMKEFSASEVQVN
ncbi:MAG: hypothetical protein WAZ40_00945 [Minisyncoccia bacterium]